MADTESVKQLAVEAARAGDKEEARNLFRLLTREKPQDTEAWLWLAGVAENQDEKRAALEQVLQYDPSNKLARESLEQMGVTPGMTAQATAPMNTVTADSDFGFDDDPFAVPDAVSVPKETQVEPPQSTRKLTPDEEFAMSLDSFGSMATSYNEHEKAGGDELDFNIPDFGMGDDDDFDMSAYMNRERVDPSEVEVTAAEIEKPKRKPIGNMRPQDETKKNKRKGGSSGFLPLLLTVAAVGIVLFLVYTLFFKNTGEEIPIAGGDVTATVVATQDPNAVIPTLEPYPGGENPGGENPGGENPGGENPGGENPDAQPTAPVIPADPELGNVQPALLPIGSAPLVIDDWFINYAGVSGIADGNDIGVQPQGRWVIVGINMFDGTATGRDIPDDLLVLKDAQGRVYRANTQASEAYWSRYGIYTNNINQTAPIGANFNLPILFDVAPDATDLIMFSPVDTTNGYYIRQGPY